MSHILEITPEEAASLIRNGQTIGFSGFTPAGAAKAIPKAIAKRAKEEHQNGNPFKIGVITGASTGQSLDGELALAKAVSFRTPYQSNKDLRKRINERELSFFDMHLSLLPQYVNYGFLGKIDYAIVEACDVSKEGSIVLSTSVGASPTFCHNAEKVLIELNEYHPKTLRGIHDIYKTNNPPHRREIPIYHCNDRIGEAVVKVDPAKIAGIVRTNLPDESNPFATPDETILKIGENVAEFLAQERTQNRIPPGLLPIQSGVGNVANAILGAMGEHPDIPPFEMYSEVIQNSVIELMKKDCLRFASGTSITVSPNVLKEVYENIEFFRKRIVLRPQEISNNPEVIRRLGVISVNTALEVDLFGNVNSTHVMGRNMMNGIGGSGDFTRAAYISVFTCPSLAKGGKISSIVPHVSHCDHNEHSVQVIITEQGIADLRGKDPSQRAETVINNCAHPDFRELLRDYLKQTQKGHTPQSLAYAFAFHRAYLRTEDMRGVHWPSEET